MLLCFWDVLVFGGFCSGSSLQAVVAAANLSGSLVGVRGNVVMLLFWLPMQVVVWWGFGHDVVMLLLWLPM
jgi:hypothetical protein